MKSENKNSFSKNTFNTSNVKPSEYTDKSIKAMKITKEDMNLLNKMFYEKKGMRYEIEEIAPREIVKEIIVPKTITITEKVIDYEATEKLKDEINNLKNEVSETKNNQIKDSKEKKLTSLLSKKIISLETTIENLNKIISSKQIELDRSNEFFNIAIKASDLNQNSLKHFVLSLVLTKEFKKKGTNIDCLKGIFGEDFQTINILSERISTLEFQNYNLITLIENIIGYLNESIQLNSKFDKNLDDVKNILDLTIQNKVINNDFIDLRNRLHFKEYNDNLEKLLNINKSLNLSEKLAENKSLITFPSKNITKDNFLESITFQINYLENLKDEIFSLKIKKPDRLNANEKDKQRNSNNEGKTAYDKPIISNKSGKSFFKDDNKDENNKFENIYANALFEKAKTKELSIIRRKYSNIKELIINIITRYKNLLEEDIIKQFNELTNENFVCYNSLNIKDFYGIILAQAKLIEKQITK